MKREKKYLNGKNYEAEKSKSFTMWKQENTQNIFKKDQKHESKPWKIKKTKL